MDDVPLSGDHALDDEDHVEVHNLVDAAIGAVQASVTTEATARANGDNTVATNAATALASHEADTTNVHGIANTAVLATATSVAVAVTAHEAAGDPHTGYLTEAAASGTYQPVDSDLTAIAALSTTSFGRALLALADAAALRTAAGLGTAATSASTDFQPVDADLTAIAALTTTSYGRAFLALADAAAGRTALGLGTASTSASGDFQPVDSDLTAIAALTTTSYGRSLLEAANAAAARTLLGLGTAAVVNTGTASGDLPLLSTGGVLPIARLATGTPDGTKFVRDDGTLAVPAGGSSTLQDVRPKSGLYFGAPQSLVSSGGGVALSAMLVHPIVIADDFTVTSIGCRCSTATASSFYRLGIYGDTGGVPGTLVVDAGQVDTSTTGFKEITISVALTKGLYWLALVQQGAQAAYNYKNTPTTTVAAPSANLDFQPIFGYRYNSITGALPSTAPATIDQYLMGGATNQIPHILLKRA